MKHFLLTATIVLTINFAGSTMAVNAQQITVAGCCKEQMGGQWINNGKNFDECVRLNAEDKDDIYIQSGTYWWDVRC